MSPPPLLVAAGYHPGKRGHIVWAGNNVFPRGDLLKKNLLELAPSLFIAIILDADSREKIIFDVLHREPEALGTLFFIK